MLAANSIRDGNCSPGTMRMLEKEFCPDLQTPLASVTQYFIKTVPMIAKTWHFVLDLFLKHKSVVGGLYFSSVHKLVENLGK